MSSNETAAGYQKIVDIDQKEATVYVQNPAGQKVHFQFDFAYPDGISQEEVYEETAAPIVSGVLEGFNGTIFAYGQTGTGKTYTMDGKSNGEHRGIVPRAFEHIFEYMATNGENQQFMVTVTYVEIYNDELRDLLASGDSEPLKIREDPQHGVTIRGVAMHKVQQLDDLWRLLAFGKKNRKVRKTNMNPESSRSHSILTLNVETLSQMEGGSHVRSARLNLVDLAGSERIAKTGAEGAGMAEGININYELMILGNCIAALTSKGNTHIPYRDSKLTMLLRDSLGGNARTMMIAALGPASYNFSETMSTLRYAERAKKIENKPKVNMDPKDALLLKYQEELAALQAQLNGTSPGGAAGGGAGPQTEAQRIAAMEAAAQEKMKRLASATNMAKAERAELERKLEEQQREIEAEKQKRGTLEAKLAELAKFVVNPKALQQVTRANDQQLQAIKERLRQREERAHCMEKEVEERRRQKQHVVDKCASIQQQVEAVSREFSELVEQYKNLKLKLPEVQKTIQADRENMAQNIDFFNKRIELYQLIIDNFVPQTEVDGIKKVAVWDEEKKVYSRGEIDKRAKAQKILSVERPKSATGAAQPSASAAKGLKPVRKDQMPPVQLGPVPVRSRLRAGPVRLKSASVEESILAAFQDTETEIVVDIPSFMHKCQAGDRTSAG
jgi:kinesin family protein 3/17